MGDDLVSGMTQFYRGILSLDRISENVEHALRKTNHDDATLRFVDVGLVQNGDCR